MNGLERSGFVQRPQETADTLVELLPVFAQGGFESGCQVGIDGAEIPGRRQQPVGVHPLAEGNHESGILAQKTEQGGQFIPEKVERGFVDKIRKLQKIRGHGPDFGGIENGCGYFAEDAIFAELVHDLQDRRVGLAAAVNGYLHRFSLQGSQCAEKKTEVLAAG